MLTYQQLVEQLHSGEQQLQAYQQFKNGFDIIEFYLEKLEVESHLSPYKDTFKALQQWLDWFITEIGYEEGVLLHNVEYINRRLAVYPAIELDIEARRRELHERLEAQRNQETVEQQEQNPSFDA